MKWPQRQSLTLQGTALTLTRIEGTKEDCNDSMDQDVVFPKCSQEYLLQNPKDVDLVDSLLQQQNAKTAKEEGPEYFGIRIAPRLLGPPRVSLPWKARKQLFETLGSLQDLMEFELQGTTMGQVVTSEMLAPILGAPNLQVFRVNAGMVLDRDSSVLELSSALELHPQLQEFRICDFLNHIRPGNSVYSGSHQSSCPFRLLDMLLVSLATIPTLHTIEISCLSSIVEWQQSLISPSALMPLLSQLPRLKVLDLSHLNLEDKEIEIFITQQPPSLRELILNNNENTQDGLQRSVSSLIGTADGGLQHTEYIGPRRIDDIQPLPGLQRFEMANNVKLTDDQLESLFRYLCRLDCPLQHFQVTYPLRQDPSHLQLHLKLHRIRSVHERFYSYQTATPSSCIQVLAEVGDDLSCLYALLRQKPTLCNVKMNSLDASSQHNGPSLPSLLFHRILRWSCLAVLYISMLQGLWWGQPLLAEHPESPSCRPIPFAEENMFVKQCSRGLRAVDDLLPTVQLGATIKFVH